MSHRAITSDTVHNDHEAIAFLVECTMATISGLLLKSKPPRGELERQISIAETGMAWIGKDYEGGCGRVEKARRLGGVRQWAQEFKPEYFAQFEAPEP